MANQNMREQLALSLSNDVLTGALVQKKKAGYQFGFTFTRPLKFTEQFPEAAIWILLLNLFTARLETYHDPAKRYSLFRVDYSGDCEYQQIHFRPDTFTKNQSQSDDGIYPIGMMHAIRFHCQTYYRQESDQVLDDCVNKIISLHSSTDSLFTAANINIAIMNIMLHILDKKRPNHDFTDPNLQNSYVAYTLDYIHKNYMHKILQEDIAKELQISVRYLSSLFKKIYDDHTVQLYQYLPHQQIH